MKKQYIPLIAFSVLAVLLAFATGMIHLTKEGTADDTPETEEENGPQPEEILNVLAGAMKKREESVDLGEWKVSRDDFRKTTFVWYFDPEIISGKISEYDYNCETDFVTTVRFEYTCSEEEAEERRNRLRNEVNRILDGVKDDWDDYDIALYLHDYLVLNTAYDSTESRPDIRNAYGCLVNRCCVCPGYSTAYKMLLNECGIECEVVMSSSLNHAWNMIRLDDKWYYVDVTRDDPFPDRPGRVNHSYFLRSSDKLHESHIADDYSYFFVPCDDWCTDSAYDDNTIKDI